MYCIQTSAYTYGLDSNIYRALRLTPFRCLKRFHFALEHYSIVFRFRASSFPMHHSIFLFYFRVFLLLFFFCDLTVLPELDSQLDKYVSSCYCVVISTPSLSLPNFPFTLHANKQCGMMAFWGRETQYSARKEFLWHKSTLHVMPCHVVEESWMNSSFDSFKLCLFKKKSSLLLLLLVLHLCNCVHSIRFLPWK